MVELQVTPSRLFPLPVAVANITFFPAFKGVCLLRIDDLWDSPQACAKMCLSTGAYVIAPDPSISPSRNNRLPDCGTCGKELANEKSESCLERQSLLAKTFKLRKHRVSCHRVERKQMSAMSTIFARNITPTFFPFRKL